MASKIAGIDVHKKVLMVVVIDARTPDSKPERRRSTIRILGPEMVEALRLLKIDIQELSLDPAARNVSLAVVKIELASASPEKKDSKRKKR
jgi:hypothetical protein